MTDDLKPCPFCGGEATWKKAHRGWAVLCEARFGTCLMNARTHYQPTKAQAITAWNTRDDQALTERAVKLALERAAEVARPKSKPKLKGGGPYKPVGYSKQAAASYDRANQISAAIRAIDPAVIISETQRKDI